MVEAVRVGTIVAHDRKAFARWTNRSEPQHKPKSLSDAQLEQALMRLAGEFPGNIEFGRMGVA